MSTTRRQFLTKTTTLATAMSVPYFGWHKKTLADESQSKNDRVAVGLIGAGGMGLGNLRTASQWIDVVAIADADAGRASAANNSLSDGKAKEYADYRAILDRKDIDVLHIATPDHWHTKPLIEAMLAGKDVYCEKPLTLTIDEGKLIRKVQKETGRVVQVGTQQRSQFNLFVKAVAMVADDRVGKIKKVTAAIGAGPTCDPLPVVSPPAELDWDRWLGPVPAVDYRYFKKPSNGKKGSRPNTNCHYEFRWWYEFSGGKLTDWGAHHVDIAVWALEQAGQAGEHGGPTGIGGKATHPVPFKNGMPVERDRYNTATAFLLTATYPDDVELIIRHDTDNGVLIEGDKGRIFVNRRKLVGAPVEALADDPLPEDAIAKAYKGLPMEADGRKAHWATFLNCVKTRKDPISDVHSHMRALNVCHLAGISARLGRDLAWDASSEQITGDDEANAMLSRPYRKGYEINMG
jgi:predicted dehydrogenase